MKNFLTVLPPHHGEGISEAKVKVKFGMFAQSTQVRPLDKPFDETV